jgi:hypothetical protein
VHIGAIDPSDYEAARELLLANHWGSRVSDPQVFAQLVSRAQTAIVAVDGDTVVGIVRALGGGAGATGQAQLKPLDSPGRGPPATARH